MNEGLKIEVARARLNAAKALLADVLEARGMEDGLPPFDLVCELRTFFAERGLKIGYPHPFEEGPGGDPRVEDEGGDADLWSTLADDMVNAIGREAATKLVAEALDAAEPWWTTSRHRSPMSRPPAVPGSSSSAGRRCCSATRESRPVPTPTRSAASADIAGQAMTRSGAMQQGPSRATHVSATRSWRAPSALHARLTASTATDATARSA